MSIRRFASALVACSLGVAACNGTTGDALITFTPYARGAASVGDPFDSNGYRIQLTSAVMSLGAVYFDESPASTGFDSPVCNTSDIFAAQVPGGVQVNLLSTAPQEFSVYGSGSADVAESWDLWLTSGDINQPTLTPTATLTGTATLLSDPSKVYGFGAIVTINPGESGGGARGVPVSDPALPGASPICKQRILQLDGLDLGFYQGGTLLVTIDPRAWFAATTGIDFANLEPYDGANCQLDSNSDAVYESFGPCDASGNCSSGLTCDTLSGAALCVQPCGAGSGCPAGYACNGEDGNCIASSCIPDTNWLSCPSALTGAASTVCAASASAGQSLYLGVLGGGTAAYSVSYTGEDASTP